MKRYDHGVIVWHSDPDFVESPDGDVYLASEVDARVAELERERDEARQTAGYEQISHWRALVEQSEQRAETAERERDEARAALNNECSLRVQATDAAYELQTQLTEARAEVERLRDAAEENRRHVVVLTAENEKLYDGARSALKARNEALDAVRDLEVAVERSRTERDTFLSGHVATLKHKLAAANALLDRWLAWAAGAREVSLAIIRDTRAHLANATAATASLLRAELSAAKRVADAAESHLEQHRTEDPHVLSETRHELWQRNSECKALSQDRHELRSQLAAANARIEAVTKFLRETTELDADALARRALGHLANATAAAPECTGVAASWCPVHGDCSCPRQANGERTLDSDECPLHSSSSSHADQPAAPSKARASSGGACPCGDQERPGHPIGWCAEQDAMTLLARRQSDGAFQRGMAALRLRGDGDSNGE